MMPVRENRENYLAQFKEVEKELAGQEQPWLERIRRDAIESFAGLGFPTTRLEKWKYTNVGPLTKIPFQPAGYELNGLTSENLSRLLQVEVRGCQLVFVNGHWCPGLSSLEELPQGVSAISLAAVLENNAGLVEAYLARYAPYLENAFVALNTAFVHDGAFIEIPGGLVVEKPIHLVFITTADTGPAVAHPRTLVVAGPSTQATLIETYLGLGEGVYFTNAVTEIVAGENSVIDHYRLQRENKQAFHIATVQAHLSRSSSFNSYNVALGGKLARNDINALLAGEGASCAFNGLYVARDRQHVDNHTTIDHAKPHCTSHELYKGILDGRATGIFNGAIIVRQDAQKTDSIQHNKNLLLSAEALINTKPQLEIYADDVKCTHGATVGQLDKDAVFYLRTRGFDQEAARRVLINAFASEILDAFKVEPLRAALQGLLVRRLASGEEAQ